MTTDSADSLADVRRIDKLRRAIAGKDGFEEAVARRAVKDFIEGMRMLCAAQGPWAFVNVAEASEEATPREVAYLLIWRIGPTCQVWEDLKRFDAVDLAIDAANEGFDAFLRDKAQAAL